MKTNQNKLTPDPSEINLIVGQFHYYAHIMDLERFTESEKECVLLYYMKVKEMLDSFKVAHRLFNFNF